MGRNRVPSIEYTVSPDLFDRAIAHHSVRLLDEGKIGQPVRWEGDWWTVVSFMLRHSGSWARLYQVIPLDEWHGPVNCHHVYDEDWEQDRERSGLYWYGVLVSIAGDMSGAQYVLGQKIGWSRERVRRLIVDPST